MNKENMSLYKNIIFPIKYTIDTQDYFYQMKPEGNLNGLLEIYGYSDE